MSSSQTIPSSGSTSADPTSSLLLVSPVVSALAYTITAEARRVDLAANARSMTPAVREHLRKDLEKLIQAALTLMDEVSGDA